jgi:signal transduction histidine kinase/DNA-binding response OmpR family regulator
MKSSPQHFTSISKGEPTDTHSLQDTLMEIANHFINVPLETADDVINTSLAKLGEFTQTDRAYVFNYDHDRKVSSNTYEWCRTGIDPQINELQNIPYEMIPDWIALHFAGSSLVIPDVLQLEPDSSLRQILEPQGIKSLIAIPMMEGSVCTGFVGFDSVNDHQKYSVKEQQLLELFALMLVNLQNRNNVQTKLSHAVQAAESASQAKSAFLANMSHEIRTPLNSIIGFTDLLKKTTLSSQQQDFVDHANSAAHTLLSIINDILDFSKVEAGQMDFEIKKTDLLALLETSLVQIRPACEQKGIALLLRMSSETPRFLFTDPVRLKQIISNLLSNAIKFTEKGEIELIVDFEKETHNDGRFQFSVRDTGIGISDTQLNHLFKPFHQADASITRKYGGSGLGLIISEKIANHFGSQLLVDNTQNPGTTFSFDLKAQFEHEYLPIKNNSTTETMLLTQESQKHAAVVAEEMRAPAILPSGGKRIMIVEDVAMNLFLLRAQLERMIPDVEIIEAFNGKEALEAYIKQPVDLIIMDLHMPEMDGIQATKEIRSWELGKQLRAPIVALTADAFLSRQQQCYEAGMDDFLTKPLDATKLQNTLNAYLKVESDFRSEDHYNKEALLQRCGHRTEVVAQLLVMVADEMPKKINAIADALNNNNLSAVAQQAHAVKGAALNVGFIKLTSQASEMEKLAKNGESSTLVLERLLSDMNAEWTILQKMLQK